jgi:class 3 adenylate cyclase
VADEMSSVANDQPGNGVLPDGRVTFLFIDIAGSTGLRRQHREA